MRKDENGDRETIVELIEIIDIEEFSKGGGPDRPPKAKKYRIRIDKQKYEVESPTLSGRQILELAGKIPPERWMLNQKFRHGEFKPVGLDDIVDLTAPGVERFTTLPKDQTEGFAPRRQFALPEEDVGALNSARLQWETIVSGGNWLIIRALELPCCFVESETSVAISIPSGYPTSPLDMAYFNPPIQRKDGRPIANTQASQMIDGVNWQRWSRHYTSANPWKPGEYNTVTHLHLIRTWLDREASK
jgi:Prokaryotic E2 family E/Multiubiquitin